MLRNRVLIKLKPAKTAGMKTVLVGRQSRIREYVWINWTIMNIFQLPKFGHNPQSNFVT